MNSDGDDALAILWQRYGDTLLATSTNSIQSIELLSAIAKHLTKKKHLSCAIRVLDFAYIGCVERYGATSADTLDRLHELMAAYIEVKDPIAHEAALAILNLQISNLGPDHPHTKALAEACEGLKEEFELNEHLKLDPDLQRDEALMRSVMADDGPAKAWDRLEREAGDR
ncbi:hypothetical protein N0V85_008159, partial [Neurospora sp. IMI 360204]